MKKKIYITISIVIMAVLFIFQYMYLAKNTVGEYVLNPKKEYFDNENNYYMLHELTNILLDEIEEKDNKTITFVLNTDTQPFNEGGIGYHMIRNDVLPMNMPLIGGFMDNYNDESNKDLIKTYNLDYILVFGKDTEILGHTTTEDYTLFEVTNKAKEEIKEIKGIKFGLYPLYIKSLETGDNTLLNNYISSFQKQTVDNFTFSALGLLKEFVMDLYEEGYYDEAIYQSNFYLREVDYINDDINMALGYMYKSQKKYKEAYEHFEICTRNPSCPKEEAEKQMEILRYKGGSLK